MRHASFNIELFRHWRERFRLPNRQAAVHEPDLLARCLAELDERGWDLDDYLAGRPDLTASVQALLRAAAQVQRAPRSTVSTEFRARARARFAASLQSESSPRRSSGDGWIRSLQDVLVPIAASVAAVLVIAGAIGGIGTASASSLPGTPLYPAKIAVESVQLFTAFTPELQAQTHLKIAEARLVEADAENQRGNQTEVDLLLKSYQQQIVDARAAAASATSPGYHRQVDQAVATLDAKRTVILPRVLAVSGETPTAAPTATASVPIASATLRPTAPAERNQDAEPPSPTRAPAASSSVASAPAPKATPEPSPSGRAGPEPRPPEGRRDDLVATLISHALAGDQPGAAAAAAAFVADLRSGHDLKQSAIVHLRHQRTQLAQALTKAPRSTAPSLQQALRAVDVVLRNTDGPAHQPGDDSSANGQGGSSQGDGPGNGNSGNGNHGGSDGHQNGSGKDH